MELRCSPQHNKQGGGMSPAPDQMARMLACDGRFTDAWVVDRTLFEHINQGSCSCCGTVHAMMDIAASMSSCSDIETDDGKKERNSNWPLSHIGNKAEHVIAAANIHTLLIRFALDTCAIAALMIQKLMVAEVWTDRVKLRKAMKTEMAGLADWWCQNGTPFSAWWSATSIADKRRILQLPTEEQAIETETSSTPTATGAQVVSILMNQYDMRGAYATVLCAVNEQLKNFHVTGIIRDGRTDAELRFEEALEAKRGAYVLPDAYLEGSGFIDLCARIGGGGKLLPRSIPSSSSSTAAKKSADDSSPLDYENSNGSYEDSAAAKLESGSPLHDGLNVSEQDETGVDSGEGQQSFRADRRLLRLIISREFFKAAKTRYQKTAVEAAAVATTPVVEVAAPSFST
eukprot:8265-Heterococcus_DN1.PRE.2